MPVPRRYCCCCAYESPPPSPWTSVLPMDLSLMPSYNPTWCPHSTTGGLGRGSWVSTWNSASRSCDGWHSTIHTLPKCPRDPRGPVTHEPTYMASGITCSKAGRQGSVLDLLRTRCFYKSLPPNTPLRQVLLASPFSR